MIESPLASSTWVLLVLLMAILVVSSSGVKTVTFVKALETSIDGGGVLEIKELNQGPV